MPEVDSLNKTVILTSNLKNCGLRDIQAKISNFLKNPHAVNEVRKFKTSSGETILGKFELDLFDVKDVQKLISEAVIYVEHDDALCNVRITRARPKKQLPTFTQTEVAETETTTASEAYSEKESTSSGSETEADQPVAVVRSTKPRGRKQFDEEQKRKQKEKQPSSVQKTSNISTSISWFDLLQSDPDIFESYSDKCVLVQPESDSISKMEIKEYVQVKTPKDMFQKPIKRINDGFLLLFEKSKVARSFLDEDHVINGFELRVFSKPVPPVYRDKFLLKGNFKRQSKDQAKSVLDCCTNTAFKLKWLKSCNMFLIILDKELRDFKKLQRDMKKLRLDSLNPQPVKVCHSDCIEVSNLKEDVFNDLIRMSFMNKKYGDGEVTLVERDAKNKKVAFVYFAGYKDAEIFMDKAKEQGFFIQSSQVQVSTYCPGINCSLDLSSFKLCSFHYNPGEDLDIIRFIHSSHDVTTDFCKSFGDLAIAGIEGKNQSFRIKIEPIENKGKEDVDVDQEKFESDCRDRIRDFSRKFKVESCHFPEEDIERVRRENDWDGEEEVFIDKKIQDGGPINVLVNFGWDENGKNVKVIGLRNHVGSFIKWFGKACDLTSQTEKFSKTDFDILINCGIIEEISSYLEEDFNANISKEELVINFSGGKANVKQAITGVKKKLKEIQECDMKFLHPIQQEFLQKFIEEEETEQSNIEEYIQDKFLESNIKTCLLHRGRSLYLKYDPKKQNELQRAKAEIQSLLKFQIIPVEGSFDDVVEEEDWKEIKKEIEASGKLYAIEDKRGSCITLVGLPSSFNSGHDKIQKYLEENVEIEEEISLPHAKAEFFSSFSNEIGVDEKLSNVEWFSVTGKIHVKGRARLVRKAMSWIQNTIQTISTQSQELNLPGMSTYFNGDSGKQAIKTASKSSTCIIKLNRSMPQEFMEAGDEQDSTYVYGEENIPSLKGESNPEKNERRGILETVGNFFGSFLSLSPQEEKSVTVKVVNGNILNSKCDVIVNTVGNDFNLKLSRVSSALIRRTGDAMVDQCAKNPLYKTKILRVTAAPNMVSKNILHLVTPESPEKIADHLSKAFKVVEKQLMLKSIAIPAIGTGQIGMSDVAVAKSIRRAIDLFRKSNPQHLNEIEVVVFEANMVRAFKDALLRSNSQDSSKASTSKPAGSTPVQMQSHNGGVSVSFGDILSSKCEAIFNTVGSDFNLQASLVSAKVLQKAGNTIHTECQSQSVHKTKACRITSGGRSGFKNIVHFITPSNVQDLAKDLEDVLSYIDGNFNIKSIAIPAIGTGNAKLNVDDVAKAFGSAINNFMSSNPKHLSIIEVVIFDKALLPHFENHVTPVQKMVPAQQAPTTSSSKPLSKLLSAKINSTPIHKTVFYFTSNSEENMRKAWKQISQKAESKCARKTIRDDVLEDLDEENLEELMAIEREFDVSLSVPDDSVENQFEIIGLKNATTDAYAYALKLLHKYKAAVTLADYVTWQYEDPKTKSWTKHSLLTSLELENSYKEDNAGTLDASMKISGEKKLFHVDFKGLIQTSQGTDKTTYKIKRSSSSSNWPSTWDGSKSRQLVQLNPQDQEYQNVLQKFQTTLPISSVIRLERVENKRLFTQFEAQKQEVQERMKSSNVNQQLTRELFHGTSHDVCEKIYKGGFNRSYAGKNATAYGNGVYFAQNSNYSNSYAVPLPNGERRMFLVDVITGEYAQGASGMIDAPQKPSGTSADLYDSVVNNMQSPTIFVVFKDASAYPLYLLTYR